MSSSTQFTTGFPAVSTTFTMVAGQRLDAVGTWPCCDYDLDIRFFKPGLAITSTTSQNTYCDCEGKNGGEQVNETVSYSGEWTMWFQLYSGPLTTIPASLSIKVDGV
jgi:hypothetical protein